MDILLTGIFIRFFSLNIQSRGTSVYVVLSTVNRRNSPGKAHSSPERTGIDFSAVKHQSHQAARVLSVFFIRSMR